MNSHYLCTLFLVIFKISHIRNRVQTKIGNLMRRVNIFSIYHQRISISKHIYIRVYAFHIYFFIGLMMCCIVTYTPTQCFWCARVFTLDIRKYLIRGRIVPRAVNLLIFYLAPSSCVRVLYIYANLKMFL